MFTSPVVKGSARSRKADPGSQAYQHLGMLRMLVRRAKPKRNSLIWQLMGTLTRFGVMAMVVPKAIRVCYHLVSQCALGSSQPGALDARGVGYRSSVNWGEREAVIEVKT